MINLCRYNSLLYHDIHFSFHYGVPFLKNSLLSFLFKTIEEGDYFPTRKFFWCEAKLLEQEMETELSLFARKLWNELLLTSYDAFR